MRSAAALPAGLFLVLFAACVPSCGGGSPTEKADAAQAAFTAGQYGEARSLCDEGLKSDTVRSDKAVHWKLERIRVEAIASSGDKGAEVVPTLARLAGEFPAQVDAQFYAKLADQVSKAGNLLGAIDVVEAGKKRFATMAAAFDGVIAYLKKAAESDDAAMEKLRALGYL